MVTQKQIDQFHTEGHLKLRQVIKPQDLTSFSTALRPLMEVLNPNKDPLEKRSTYRKAFNQVTNLWLRSEAMKAFVFRRDLARLAAEILGVDGVRLYHDQALHKEAGGGATPWHVDQVYWPMDTDKTCTFWIPLQDTARDMGCLSFAKGSHLRQDGRDMVISDASEAFFSKWVNEHGFDISDEEFELGDISAHLGWTVHHAGPNLTTRTREVMTIIYMDADARLKEPLTDTKKIDRDAFTPGVDPGQIMNSDLSPLLYKK